MNTDELNAVVDETLKELRQLLTVKGGEYSSSHDRLINFKRGAALTGVKPMTVLLVYLSKHYDAFCTFVRDQQTGESRPRSEAIKGRLHDLINYCILAIALLEEAEKEDKTPLATVEKMLELKLINGHIVVILAHDPKNPIPQVWGGQHVIAHRVDSGNWIPA